MSIIVINNFSIQLMEINDIIEGLLLINVKICTINSLKVKLK